MLLAHHIDFSVSANFIHVMYHLELCSELICLRGARAVYRNRDMSTGGRFYYHGTESERLGADLHVEPSR